MTYDEDSETYDCKNQGCQSGGSFEDAPASWYLGRNLNSPTNCPDCRAWRRAQVDEDVSCLACEFGWRISSGLKLTFHRQEGVWSTPTHCRRCQDDPEWRRRAERRRATRSWRPLADPTLIPALAASIAQKDLELIDREMVTLYGKTTTVLRPVSIPSTRNEWERIPGQHGSRWDHTFYRPDGGGHAKELRHRFAVRTDAASLIKIARITTSTNPRLTMQFIQNDGRMVFYDRGGSGVIVIVDGKEPITAFPRSGSSVAKQVRDGRWTPLQ